MATIDVKVSEIKKSFELGKLSILLLFITSLMMYFLSQTTTLEGALTFYALFILFLFIYALAKSWVQNKKRFIFGVLDYDLNSAWLPMFIWGVGLFIAFGVFHKMMGSTITLPTFNGVFHQLFVSSSESFIFVVLLPESLGDYYGRVPLTGYRIPGWFWGACFFFGTFHIFAYSSISSSIYELALRVCVAMVMGGVFYWLYAYGKKSTAIGGLAATIALHWVWNVWAIMTSSVIGFVL